MLTGLPLPGCTAWRPHLDRPPAERNATSGSGSRTRAFLQTLAYTARPGPTRRTRGDDAARLLVPGERGR